MKPLLIARIVGVHGIRGLVKLRAEGDTLSDLAAARALTDRDGRPVGVGLKSQLRGNWLAAIDGIADHTAAEALIGAGLYAARDSLPATGDGEIYVADLVGLAAIDQTGRRWGMVEAVENYGAGDLLALALADGRHELLPFADPFVPGWDIAAGTVTISPPPDWLPPA